MRYISLFLVLGGPGGSWTTGNVAYLTPHLLSVGVDPIRVALARGPVHAVFRRVIWVPMSTDYYRSLHLTFNPSIDLSSYSRIPKRDPITGDSKI